MKPSGKVMKNGLMSKPHVILMNVCWRYNMNYVMMFFGVFILILIPEYASITSFALQGLLGLTVFGIGAINLISSKNNA